MLPILCYHQVGPESQEGRRLNVSPETLESHVRHFVRKGRRFARAGDLADGIPSEYVCFTFDDAFASAVERATEILARYGVWGTFYAVPSKVGATSDWDRGHEKPLATWEGLLGAQARGMEIGNHSLTHADLSRLSLEAQAKEIEGAEDLLIEHGLDGRSVCYPYGRFNEQTRAAMEREEIKVGLALGRRPARPGDDLMFLPRIVVGYSDRLPKLLYKIHLRPKLPSFKRRAHYVS